MTAVVRLVYNLFFSLLFVVAGLISSVMIIVIAAPLAFLPESIRFDNRWYFQLMRSWSWILVKSAGIRYSVEGVELLQRHPAEPAIIIANHASVFDIPLLELTLAGYPHLWISKESYTWIPLFSFLMTRINVSLRRENPVAALKSLAVAIARVKDRSRHVVIFPEGTRHDDGQVHQFMSGFVMMARKLNRPVAPIALIGTAQIFPKRSLIVDSYSTSAKLIVGPRFSLDTGESDEQFVSRVHAWFVQATSRRHH